MILKLARDKSADHRWSMRNKQPSVNPEANITTYVRKSKVTTAI
jgi:hypothetical protein